MSTPSNPYTALLYSAMRELGAEVGEFSINELLRRPPDIWHLHWPDHVLQRRWWLHAALRGVILLGLVALVRRRGGKVVWTTHNLHSHNRPHPRLERWFWKRLTNRLDGYISPTRVARQLVLEQFPALGRAPGFVIPLGHYRDVYPRGVTRTEARVRLGIPEDRLVIGFVGRILRYKNVPHLVRTFRKLTSPEALLLIAGEPMSAAIHEAVALEAQEDPRVKLALQHVPGDLLQVYFAAADLIVFPYTDILNSASALLALSFDRPVLVPAKGSMVELREDFGAEWVATYDGQLTPETLAEAASWATGVTRGTCRFLDRLEWARIAEHTIDALSEVRRADQR